MRLDEIGEAKGATDKELEPYSKREAKKGEVDSFIQIIFHHSVWHFIFSFALHDNLLRNLLLAWNYTLEK